MDSSESNYSLSSGSQSAVSSQSITDTSSSTSSQEESQQASAESAPVSGEIESARAMLSEILAGKTSPTSDQKQTPIILDSDGNVLIDICVDQSPTDDRKTFFFRVSLANHDALPELVPGGAWERKKVFTYPIDPKDFIRLTVVVEAFQSGWCPTAAAQARSADSSWPEMNIGSNTQRMISISATELANGEVVSNEWCGTCSSAFGKTTIPGALELKDEFEDGIADGGRELFELCTQRSYPNGQPQVVIFSNKERTITD